jgi:hypothetical protein
MEPGEKFIRRLLKFVFISGTLSSFARRFRFLKWRQELSVVARRLKAKSTRFPTLETEED